MINHNELRRLRRSKRMTIKEVAAMIGKDRSTLWRYENGDTQVKAEVLFQLAAIYEVPVEQFYERSER